MKKQILTFFIVAGFFSAASFAENDFELGATVSNYRYSEPDVMDLRARGVNFGLDFTGTIDLDSYWFMRGNIIGVFGKSDYRSYRTGAMDNGTNWYIDARGLFGRKYEFYNYALSPYFGLGFRHLYHDGRGISSTGAKGYRRESNYMYLPIGIEHTLDFLEESQFITNIEFDYLIMGKQTSYLSDVNSLNSDFIHWQRQGFGARGSIKYRLNHFSIGP